MSRTARLAHPGRLFIGGRWTDPDCRGRFTVLDAATERPFAEVAEAGEADVARAIAAARAAFDDGPWPRMDPRERAGHLRRLAGLLAGRADDIAVALGCETGMVQPMAAMMARLPATIFTEHAAYAEVFAFEEKRASGPGGAPAALLVHEPVGVVAAIVSWNGPAAGLAQKVAPALLCGCTVVAKLSPEAPTAGYLLAEAAEEAGLPPGVLNMIAADRAASEALVADPRVDMVAFTGSTAAGRRIAAICGQRIARTQLELGGKNPAVILDDYDLDVAAAALAGSARFLAGQVCAALTRIIVPRARHDALADALAAAFGATRVGDPFDPATQMGPLAFRGQRERVERYIAAGRSEGARLATGGGRPAGLAQGWFVEPTVFAGVDNASTIGREEIFGPVLVVVPAADEADALRLANDTDFGLNAAVFTRDPERAYAAARRLRSGTVGHNGGRVDLSIGFGGFKQSGFGREGGGAAGLAAYLERKTVLLDAYPAHLGGPA